MSENRSLGKTNKERRNSKEIKNRKIIRHTDKKEKESTGYFSNEQYIRMAEEMERELFADGDSEIQSTDEHEKPIPIRY